MPGTEQDGDATARIEQFPRNKRASLAQVCAQLSTSPEQFPARLLGHHAHRHIGTGCTCCAKHSIPLLLWIGLHRQAFILLTALRLRPDSFTLLLHLWA